MLVLTRKVGEKLVIGNEIVVEVLSISGEGVRLGVVAPRETSIHRYEVFEEIQAANRAASAPSASSPNIKVEDIAARLRVSDEKEPPEVESEPET
jgi:carbon storage regulator